MTMMVQASTDDVPELLALIEQRHASGLDRYDEWWQGVYRVVTGPSYEHGVLVADLGELLGPRARARGLRVAIPVNIGLDKDDARVPDLAVCHPDTPRTSQAFLSTAELVVEILSPGERPGEKLPFYARWHVNEYLEIDLAARATRLLAHHDGHWARVEHSTVIDLSLDDVTNLLAAG